jgi:hypothetical protein
LSPGTCPGNPPCTETILRRQSPVLSPQLSETTGTKHQLPCPTTISCRIISLSTQQTPLNTLPRSREDPSPARTLAKDKPHPVRHATAARPETHQNLIHINKEHAPKP